MWELLWFTAGTGVGVLGHVLVVRVRTGRAPVEPAEREEAVEPVEPKMLPAAEIRDEPPTTILFDDDEGEESAVVESADHMAWLRGADGDYLLNLVTNVVGAAEHADVLLDAGDIARVHAVIRTVDGRWWLESVASRTLVNDTPVWPGESAALRDGDQVRFGSTAELTMFIPSGDAPVVELELDVAGASETGERLTNQDKCHHDQHLIVVADGVAGRPAGNLAAELTVRTVAAAGRDQEFSHTVRQANLAVRAQGESDPRTAGMATTLDAAVLRWSGTGYRMYGVHVGDGIALMQRGSELRRLTHAHTLASELVASGRLHASQSEDHPGASTLLRAVGLDRTITPDLWVRRAEPGTRFLLASDGLLAALGNRRLETELRALHDVSPRQCVDRLVEAALACGAPDNVTVVVGDVVIAGASKETVPSGKAFERGPLDRRLLPPARSADGA